MKPKQIVSCLLSFTVTTNLYASNPDITGIDCVVKIERSNSTREHIGRILELRTPRNNPADVGDSVAVVQEGLELGAVVTCAALRPIMTPEGGQGVNFHEIPTAPGTPQTAQWQADMLQIGSQPSLAHLIPQSPPLDGSGSALDEMAQVSN